MKIKLTLIAILFIANNISAQPNQDFVCRYWKITPNLYSNYKSDSTKITCFKDYWYYENDISPESIPDSLFVDFWEKVNSDKSRKIPEILIIDLDIDPSTALEEDSIKKGEKIRIKSELSFKYGLYQDSYNVINPMLSKPILLLNQEIDLKDTYKILFSGKNILSPIKIPIKQLLRDLKIDILDGAYEFKEGESGYYLNQIVINSYFIDKNNKIICSSEFIFPINGPYDAGDRGVKYEW
ncbi:MAG: hypothetical protein VB048_11735 [Bacteroidaceae bacterium]|nr:hypothetical protein [Bacteroidaceae bacterium]MEA5098946.1 hypothetical protein [Bacteroidales bacterium]